MITVFENLDEAVKVLGKEVVEKECERLWFKYNTWESEMKSDSESYTNWYSDYGQDLFWYYNKELTYAWKDNFECELQDELKELIKY